MGVLPLPEWDNKSHTRLKEAYLYFKEKVSSHISDNDINKKYEKLISLYNAFTSNFIIMYIESTDINEAFVIFETLNARGKDLETADLLKNYIFRSSGKYISEIKEKWLSIIETLDKLNTPPAKAGGFTVATKRMSGMFFDFKRCGNLVP